MDVRAAYNDAEALVGRIPARGRGKGVAAPRNSVRARSALVLGPPRQLCRRVGLERVVSKRKIHLCAGDFSACGRCGPTLQFTKFVERVTCKSCRNAIVVNLNDSRDWRLKHPWPSEEE